MLPLLHKGSVKDVYGIEKQAPYVFDFSNRYSVFDWGEMPDELESKGNALAYMSALFFDLFEDKEFWRNWTPQISLNTSLEEILSQLRIEGLQTHFGKIIKKGDDYTTKIEVSPVNVLKPKFIQGNWDYKDYKKRPENTLVPLEMIFRFGVPNGSSLMKRVDDAKYLESLGLTEKPRFGDKFEIPVIEFSTKLETTDTYLTYDRAQEISAMTDIEFKSLHGRIQLIALRLKDFFSNVDIDLWDGKLEFGFGVERSNARDFLLVDSIGPDELRLTYDGISLSKENLRHFYRNSSWHMATEEAKNMAKVRGVEDWKQICSIELDKTPGHLDVEFKKFAESIYTSLANELGHHYKQEKPFLDSKDLVEVMTFFKRY